MNIENFPALKQKLLERVIIATLEQHPEIQAGKAFTAFIVDHHGFDDKSVKAGIVSLVSSRVLEMTEDKKFIKIKR